MWTYYCAGERENITGRTKEDLADQIVQHLREKHDKSISYDEALEMVNKGAKQEAA